MNFFRFEVSSGPPSYDFRVIYTACESLLVRCKVGWWRTSLALVSKGCENYPTVRLNPGYALALTGGLRRFGSSTPLVF